MPDLTFHVESVAPTKFAAVPQLTFRLRIRVTSVPVADVQSLLLNTQIRIEPTRRSYTGLGHPGLRELFGDASRWNSTMRSLLWTHVTTIVPGFVGDTSIELVVPCTFDFNVAATKYIAALDEGEIPLCFLYSGTMFYQSERGLQVSPISWESECSFRLPVEIWRELRRRHEPRHVWLSIPCEQFEQLHDFKVSHSLPTWEQALQRLLDGQESPSVPGTAP